MQRWWKCSPITTIQPAQKLYSTTNYKNCRHAIFSISLYYIICDHLNDNAIRHRILAETKLDCKNTLEIKTGVIETVAKSHWELHSSGTAEEPQSCKEIDNVTLGPGTSSNGCHKCGRSNNKPSQCPFISAKWHDCGKTGHVRSLERTQEATMLTREVYPSVSCKKIVKLGRDRQGHCTTRHIK